MIFMAESQKTAAPSVKSKEKNSLLDMDIDKDFLGSWKSMGADDGMDFDFGPTTGGNKKSSKSDKMSDVHPSTLIEPSKRNLPQISLNPGLQPTNMASASNMKKFAVEKNRISSSKAEMKTSEVSTLRVSRITEPKLKPLSTLLPKNLTSMRNKEQGVELQGNLVLKRNPAVDTKKQTPSTPTLKRKASEDPTEITRLTPLKRISASPSNSIRASSPKVVETQICNYASVSHDKSPRFDVSHIEMDISSSIDEDSIFEKAEACSKELKDICNMLKMKHEEAKEILVRAVVNNNNLLMLNHPIYQDKIHMVQKFAALLISK